MVKKINELGFTLFEVMIALTLFAVFSSAFLVSQGYNLADSELIREDLKLQTLCEKKMGEFLLDTPPFTNASEDLKETKSFEEKDLDDYEWTLELKKMSVPDFTKLAPQKSDDEEAEIDDGNQQKIEAMIHEKMKENFEKLLWQVRITVRNKKTKYNYELSTWVLNSKEKVQLNLNM